METQDKVGDLVQRLIAEKISKVSPGLAIAFTIASEISKSEIIPPQFRQTASAVQVGAVIAAIAKAPRKAAPKRRRRRS
jgi:hypothetical protein